MPIDLGLPVHRVSQQEFHAVDKLVTGMAFDIHNEFGRFCDEKIYRNELLHRCEARGLKGCSEIEIRASYETFSKSYFIDLLLDHSIIYELKTTAALTGNHKKQILNYLLLANLAHGALISFRPVSVQHEFASTQLNSEDRYKHTIIEDHWKGVDDSSCRFRNLIESLVKEWGSFLDSNLFIEAATHFFGGEDHVVTPIPIVAGSRTLGLQKVRLLNPETSFTISATTKNIGYYRSHIKRFLDHTNLHAVQWVNLNRHQIEFRTVT
ncbi:MAG: GxxExxY protein [Kiritimatiellales bacterium]|nr:GxxExxY protein [Kiritimatiellales bacterium]